MAVINLTKEEAVMLLGILAHVQDTHERIGVMTKRGQIKKEHNQAANRIKTIRTKLFMGM